MVVKKSGPVCRKRVPVAVGSTRPVRQYNKKERPGGYRIPGTRQHRSLVVLDGVDERVNVVCAATALLAADHVAAVHLAADDRARARPIVDDKVLP